MYSRLVRFTAVPDIDSADTLLRTVTDFAAAHADKTLVVMGLSLIHICGGQCLLLWAKPAPAQQRLHRGIARRRLSINRPRPGGAQRPAQQEGSIAPSAPCLLYTSGKNAPAQRWEYLRKQTAFWLW